MRAVFLDKDGTLVENVPYNIDPRLLQFTPGAVEALRLLREAGYALVVATNQSGVARGYYTHTQLDRVQTALIERLSDAGVTLDGYYVCPHHPAGALPAYAVECACRKPKPGMLLRASRELGIDLRSSWMVGDILDDVEAGRRAGCRTVLVDRGGETEWLPGPFRDPHLIAPDLLTAARVLLGEAEDSRLEAVVAP